ncbi:MAG: hypothetical protein IJA85_01845 [Clostridia bacterium]|nr:hypothetical protein [Clostridia bacterium]
MKRKIALLLLALLLSQTLAACSTSDPANDDLSAGDVTTAVEETTAAETGPIVYIDDLGEYDFEQHEFRIHTRQRNFFNGELVVEETGDVLDDTIYARNRTLEERFNITISEVYGEMDAARRAITAGDNDYDMISTRCISTFTLAQEGLLYKVSDIDLIDLSKGYWDASLNEDLKIGNEQYLATGAFNLTAYDFVHTLVFNKDMIEQQQVENPYELVNSNKWTFEAFERLSKGATQDINGDSTMNDDDSYGLLSQPKAVLPGFWIGAGEQSIDRDDQNYPVFNLTSDTNFSTVIERIFEITWDTNAWYPNTYEQNEEPALTNMFKNNKGLFMDMTFFYIPALRDMETDFGIIPYPKWDENQENYLTRVEGAELFGVPITAENLERTGAIIEAMACESMNEVIPVYYDLSLKTKVTRDEESAKMLDIIFANRVFDWGDTFWCDNLRDTEFQSMFKADDRSLASRMAKVESKLNQLIEDMKTALAKLDK